MDNAPIGIADNGTYRTIRMHQEREYPTRVVGTELRNPDFTAYAKAFGGFGVTVEKTADFAAAFKAAEKSGKPAIIHLKVDTNASTPGLTREGIRAKSLVKSEAVARVLTRGGRLEPIRKLFGMKPDCAEIALLISF